MTAGPRPDAEAIVRALRGKWRGGSAMCPCPAHDDGTASLHLTLAADGRILLKCHGGCPQTVVLDALRRLGLWSDGASRGDRSEKAASAAGRKDERREWPAIMPVPELASDPPPPRARAGEHHEARHVYCDEDGEVLLYVDRFRDTRAGGKRFCPLTWRHPPGQPERGQWAAYGPTGKLPLYGRDRLRGAEAVLLVEGERTADAAQEIAPSGFAVVTFMCGASAADRADYRPLAGLPVTGWPDHDPQGQKAMATALRHAGTVGATVRGMVAVPVEFPAKWDLGDSWPEPGADPATRIAELIDKAAAVGERAHGEEREILPSSSGLGAWDAGSDDGVIPPRGWLYGRTFCRGFLSSLIGAGAAGKTATRLVQALSVATGRSLTGERVHHRGRVLFLSFEDGRDELRRRVRAAQLHHDIKTADLKGWLFLAAPKGLRLAEMIGGSYQAGALETVLRETIIQLGIDLVILDPFIKLHTLEENSNSGIDFVCALLARLATELNIAVDAPHHIRKGGAAPGDADGGRGATAFRDAGRLIYTLTNMSAEEAEQLGVSDCDRRCLVRVDPAKVNIAASADDAVWLKVVGVNLGNATPDYPEGDSVQTVEVWLLPNVWSVVNPAVANRILDAIEAGLPDGSRYSDSATAGARRAAWRLVQVNGPSLSEAQCRKVITTWLKNGTLEKRDYYDKKERKDRVGLYVNAMKRPGARDE